MDLDELNLCYETNNKRSVKNQMYMAVDIAKYIINKCTIEQCPISNLQLQKILYCIQRDFLQNDMLAFDDDFEAWPFGPVIPEVYYRYCGFGALGICIKYDVDVDSDYAAIINPIIERKRMMNSWDWSKDINISGKAWDQVYDGGKGDHKIIPKRLIKEENNIALELEKRLAYIHDFFASLSDEEFVAMLLECGIEKTKRASESDYVKVFCSDEKEIRGKKMSY